MEELKIKTHVGDSLPVEYERALSGVQYLLRKAQAWYQTGLKDRFIQSQAFQSIIKVTAVGQDPEDKYIRLKFDDDSQLYQKDSIAWCLHNLTKDPSDRSSIERSVVLQHLEKILETCPRREMERIDQEMYKCISDMSAVERMLSMLDLHRPSFAFGDQNPFLQPNPAWRVEASFGIRILTHSTHDHSASMGLGTALQSSARVCIPSGKRDEQWLTRRDEAQHLLNDLWKTARQAWQMLAEVCGVSQSLIEPQLALMNQGESPDHTAQLDLERKQILSRLEEARQKALAKSQIPPEGTVNTFTADCSQPAYRTEETTKQKTKTRPDGPPTSQSLNAQYANLNVDDKVNRSEKSLPVLYTLKQNSIEYQVISRMFPDRSEGMEDGRKTIDWRHFVSTMHTLGFGAEHHGGSAFTFKGAIKLPSNLSTLHIKSMVVHRPHPRPEMGPVLLQAVGKCCNKRFGWERANFADKASDEGQVA